MVKNDSYQRTYRPYKFRKVAIIDSDRKKINLIPTNHSDITNNHR